MADTSTNQKTSKVGHVKKMKDFFSGVKAEFKKIIWPDKELVLKQSVAVVGISVVLGVIIAILDFILQNGVNLLSL